LDDYHMKIQPPNVLVLPITDSCGGRCQMCGIWRTPNRPPVSIECLAQVFSESYLSANLTHINVTGGEPLHHPDLRGLARLFSSRCPALREVSINTSGLNPVDMEQIPPFREALLQSVLLNITVSVDGIGVLHDRIRGVKDAWKHTSESIDRALAIAQNFEQVSVQINCTISRDNYDAIDSVIRFARERQIALSLTYAAVNDLYLRNDDPMHGRFTLTDGHQAALAGYLDNLQENEAFPATQRHFFRMLSGMLRGQPRSSPCVYQSKGIFLDLDGTVYPCGTARALPYGKLPEESFEAIYCGPKGDKIRCELQARFCPGCPTNSYYGLADGVWLEVLRAQRCKK
jgi:MoaA/NifB/PqqE/SkfB family radical SAM enzyme